MTLAEFLENDVDGYEYVKGELVPMSPPTRIHSKISVNVIRHLDRHVRENQLGEVHVEATFQVGERGLKPDVAFVSTPRLGGDENKGFPIPPDLAIEVVSPTDVQWRVARQSVCLSERWYAPRLGSGSPFQNGDGLSFGERHRAAHI